MGGLGGSWTRNKEARASRQNAALARSTAMIRAQNANPAQATMGSLGFRQAWMEKQRCRVHGGWDWCWKRKPSALLKLA